jgi:SOS-response transcriptional repressor LexA
MTSLAARKQGKKAYTQSGGRKTMKGLTDKQALVLEYIVKYRQERGISPAFREIAGHFGVSLRAVQGMAGWLRKKGMLTWAYGRSRTLRAAPVPNDPGFSQPSPAAEAAPSD